MAKELSMTNPTLLADVQDQIQKFWSPLFMPELLEDTILPSLVNREYEGDLKEMGDTVKVSQIKRPAGQTKTVGVDANTFTPEKMVTEQVEVKAEKRFIASFEFEDLVMLQSQIKSENSSIRQALLESIDIQLNNYLYGLVAPAAPQIITGVTNFNASQLNSNKKIASKQKWAKKAGLWTLYSPEYGETLRADTVITSGDFGSGDKVSIGGEVVEKRYGFNMAEDNSAGLETLMGLGADGAALTFHPDFMYLVMQQQPRFKVSDLHSNEKFGFVISVDMVGGAKIGLEGDVKHILTQN